MYSFLRRSHTVQRVSGPLFSGGFLLLWLLVGCELTPYRPLGFHGGYSNSHLGDATYRVYVQGTTGSDYDTIKGYFHRRAGELCRKHGTSLYEVVELEERPCTLCLTVKPEIVGNITCIGRKGQAITTQRRMIRSRIDQDFTILANQLMKESRAEQSLRLGVLPFQNTKDNRPGQLGMYCADKLTAALFTFPQLQIIERAQLASVVQELKLAHSGGFDEKTIKSVGRLLGADAIVVGSYTVPEKVETDITARIIDVESGQVRAVGSVKVPRVWVEGLLQ